jgi:uncharacterized protein (TIGR00369 family)
MAPARQPELDPLAAYPWARTLGARAVTTELGRARLHLPHRTDNTNRNGTLHGGAVASLVAMAGELAVEPAVASPERERAVVDLSIHFLAPAADEAVTADATVERRGREIAFATIVVRSDAGTLVARGMLIHRAARGARVETPAVVPPPDELPAETSRHSRSPLTRRLGIRVSREVSGDVLAVLPDQAATADREGRIDTGALATLMDCAGGAAAWSAFGRERRGRASTVALHLACGMYPRGQDVVAQARSSLASPPIFVNEMVLRATGSGRIFAAGSVTYRIVTRDPGA